MASSTVFLEVALIMVLSTNNLFITLSLAFGVLFGDKIKCPAHNAAFNVTDGAPDEGPMLDGLQKFPVEVHGD